MAQPFLQSSFNSGEWAPNLWARTDLEKYHSGAALLENFFVDYRGGASTRSGTKYVLRAYKDTFPVRLIPFQASISTGFVLEFGERYIRFHRNGAPVLETALNITGATQANPCVVSVVNSYAVGDWVYISGVNGMTQLNGKYYIVAAAAAGSITLNDLFGNPVNSSTYGAWTSGGTVQRVYTLPSPYAASDLATLKWVENISSMILTHPSYAPYELSFISAASWILTIITFGATVAAPTNVSVATTLAGGTVNYSYLVTALDINNQESGPSSPGALANKTDLRTVAGTNRITWTAVSNARSYNVYKAVLSYSNAVVANAAYGYIGNTQATTFDDSNITPDFSRTPPIVQNPFLGAGVASIAVTAGGNYTGATVPAVTVGAAPAGGVTAAAQASCQVFGTPTVNSATNVYAVGDAVQFSNGVVLIIAAVNLGGIPTAFQPITYSGSSPGSITLGTTPATITAVADSFFVANVTWQVGAVNVTSPGAGYTTAPAITFSAGAAAATSTLAAASAGNPAVPTFYQQRLVLAGPTSAPDQLNFSQPGSYFNYNVSNPVQDDDAIQASIVSGQLSNIKAMIPQPGGLIVYTDDVTFLINGGSQGAPISPSAIVANAQSHIGCNDMPPIVVNFDILTVQSKGSSVRDSTYNFYANVYTGSDISITSSHLFFGYQLLEWAWAEEPYKIVWAVRDDGMALSLTFIKEQEFIAWAHHATESGDASFKSVASIVEAASVGYQNFTYWVVERTIGATTVQYIEYFPERGLSTSAQDYWTVDCAISYSGPPVTNFQGAEFLAGKTVTGLADGAVITPFVMPASGNFTLPTAASNVKIGLAFTCDLQTLYIDLGNPTVQSKDKKINAVTVRVTDTLGLKIGTDTSNLVPMKDLVIGNVGSMTNQRVTGLVTGDAQTYLDPRWQEPGQFYIRQDQPFPASVLGVMPQVAVGDTPK